MVENVTIDGVMQSPGRPDEDTRGGFEHGGWANEHLARDPEAAQRSMGQEGAPTALLLGHRTYEDMIGFWLDTDQPNPFTQMLRTMTKYVVSRDPAAELEHPNSVLLVGEAVETVPELTTSEGEDLVVLGSGELARDLTRAGLVDRFQLTTIPVVLGTGARLFETQVPLEAESTWASPLGAVVATYRVTRS